MESSFLIILHWQHHNQYKHVRPVLYSFELIQDIADYCYIHVPQSSNIRNLCIASSLLSVDVGIYFFPISITTF